MTKDICRENRIVTNDEESYVSAANLQNKDQKYQNEEDNVSSEGFSYLSKSSIISDFRNISDQIIRGEYSNKPPMSSQPLSAAVTSSVESHFPSHSSPLPNTFPQHNPVHILVPNYPPPNYTNFMGHSNPAFSSNTLTNSTSLQENIKKNESLIAPSG